jgi:hypothetical protein
MRKTLAAWLRRLAEWLDPVSGVSPELVSTAKRIVLETQNAPHTGAYKAVLALKALRKLHPGIRQRDLRLAIELAVREVL